MNQTTTAHLNSSKELIKDIRQGKMVILMDDEDRENEGDLIIAASSVTAEDINFMARYGRGLICLTLTHERCEQLRLPLMVHKNGAQFSTNFTLSIEAAEGVTTGISAADRAKTIAAAVADNAEPSDLVQPGHIFPIMAQPGGVLTRAGHTEAGCDLARLAGLTPAAVIVEILNEDGTMARRPQLEQFARTHQLKIGSIADLIEYRSINEKTVTLLSHCHWPTQFGDFQLFCFKDTIDGQLHFALVKGEIKATEAVFVRVHMEDTFTDVLFGDRVGRRSWPLERALARISNEDCGVLLVLSGRENRQSLEMKIKEFQQQDAGVQSLAEKKHSGSRTIGIGSQILHQLGVSKMRLMSEEKRYYALSGFNLEVVEYILSEDE